VKIVANILVADDYETCHDSIQKVLEGEGLAVHVPAPIISAFADSATEALVMEFGALHPMKKPIRRQELIERTSMAVTHIARDSDGESSLQPTQYVAVRRAHDFQNGP
jgi:DNA-binding response OmpR family regulator